MSDRICYRCDDQGGPCCSEWCHQRFRWHFIRCNHLTCWDLNGQQGIPPGGRLQIKEWP